MEKYTYLLLSLSLLSVWLVVFSFLANELRKILIKISIIGGLAGGISELWYFNDYWHPPSLFSNTKISLEDFLFGFAFTGIAATLYKITFRNRKESKKTVKGHQKLFFVLFITGLFSLLLFNNLLKINSIFVSSFAFLAFSSIMVFVRKDLIVQSIMSGILSLLIAIPIYILLFNWISPTFWDKYWLLANTTFGIKVIGNIPVTELLWYFSWGCLAGIACDFYYGSNNKSYARYR